MKLKPVFELTGEFCLCRGSEWMIKDSKSILLVVDEGNNFSFSELPFATIRNNTPFIEFFAKHAKQEKFSRKGKKVEVFQENGTFRFGDYVEIQMLSEKEPLDIFEIGEQYSFPPAWISRSKINSMWFAAAKPSIDIQWKVKKHSHLSLFLGTCPVVDSGDSKSGSHVFSGDDVVTKVVRENPTKKRLIACCRELIEKPEVEFFKLSNDCKLGPTPLDLTSTPEKCGLVKGDKIVAISALFQLSSSRLIRWLSSDMEASLVRASTVRVQTRDEEVSILIPNAPWVTVDKVKKALFEITDYPVHTQNIFLNGNELKNEDFFEAEKTPKVELKVQRPEKEMVEDKRTEASFECYLCTYSLPFT
eukprot:TRINITY_DN16729_c0_g1_i1.p1 TRINITY_DN16729_c0_g1~~TRINITY_DN16729_c0_g1_i1.p1  ORF type:complete len:394 (+),score=84.61 TRINITY_DN16729_c0_g1_i1:101-1183(+)